MNKKRIGSISLLFLIVVCMFSSVNAIVCITMAKGGEWEDAKIKVNEPAYFSFRVYNSSADGRECDASTYEIEITLLDSEEDVKDVFDWTVDSPVFELGDTENKRVLLTLVPKQLGFYVVNVTAKLMPKGSGGTQLVYTTSAKINASVSIEGDESYSEIPFWKIRKDCPNGLVVKQGEECPRLCEDGTQVYESKGERCPEDPVGFFGALGLGDRGEIMFWGAIGGVIATIAILGAVAYKRKHETYAPEEVYNADQGY